MVNRYDRPAQAEFVNTYVPIPFQELVTIGKELNARRDKAQETLNSTLNDWKKFYSPSQKDMEMWDSLTINNPAVRDVINKTVSDPNYIKTAEGQAAIAGLTNSVNVKALRQLQANAAQLTQYQNNYADMLSKGLQVWDPIDVANYNTLGEGGKGILSNTSPMLRQEIVDIVTPYVKDLGDTTSILGDYLFTGRSKKRLGDQIEANRANILSDPQSMKHIEELTKKLGSKDAAINAFMDQAKQAAYRFEQGTLSANPFKLVDYKNTKNTSGSVSSGDGNGATGGETPMSFTQEIETSGRAAVNNAQHRAINKSLERNAPDHFKALQTAIANRDAAKSNGNTELEVQYQNQIDQIMTAVDALPNRDAILSDAELPKYFRDTFLLVQYYQRGKYL